MSTRSSSVLLTALLLALGGTALAQPSTPPDATRAERHAARIAAIDANADGFITPEELDAHRTAQREARRARRFARMDGDGDGRVSVAEFDAALARMQEHREHRRDHRDHRGMHGGRDGRPMRGMGAPLEAAAIDTNRDGFITAEELAAARAARQAAMRDAHFKALDTDGDGRVSVAEFDAGHAGPKDGRGRRGRGGPASGG